MLRPEDYLEPACPFEKPQRPLPPAKDPIDIHLAIAEYDALLAKEDWQAAGECLKKWRAEAEKKNDLRGQLSILSEMMGHFRQCGDRQASLEAVHRGIDIMKELKLGHTSSAGTILVNAATALSAFGENEQAIPIFKEASRCFAESIDPGDLRFAALYNNLAAAMAETKDHDGALRHYLLALEILQHNGENMDRAVTYLNIAGLLNRLDPADERINTYAELAEECFDRDTSSPAYYKGYTARKCAKAADELGFFLLAQKLHGIADCYYERS